MTKAIVTEENGVRSVVNPINDGYTPADVYYPHSCPWDYYGNKWLREMKRVLTAANIPCQEIACIQRKLSPMGSGPGGRIRMGDDMLPGKYTIAVPADMLPAALEAIKQHKLDIRSWLDGDGPMPEACR